MAGQRKKVKVWYGLGSAGMFSVKTVWAWLPVRSEEGELLWMEWVERREQFVFSKEGDAGEGQMVVKHWPISGKKGDAGEIGMSLTA